MAVAERRVKIVFPLEQDQEGYPPAAAESLWATPLGGGLFRIDNIPFFVRGIALGDVVSAESERHGTKTVWRFANVSRASGHGTLRVVVYDESQVDRIVKLVEGTGAGVERSHLPRLLAVDVPDGACLHTLRRLLDPGRAQDRWDYEESCVAFLEDNS